MKPGDKVWWYDPWCEKIYDGVVCKKYCAEEHHFFEVTADYEVVPPFATDPIIVLPVSKAFPTREALCEHYRKIFE